MKGNGETMANDFANDPQNDTVSINLSESNPLYDHTPITWGVQQGGDIDTYDVMVCGPEEDSDMARDAMVCWLEYPSEEARNAAIEAGKLGVHLGNVTIAFPNVDLAYVASYGWRNSSISHEDVNAGFLYERCLPIPFAVAKKIHPAAVCALFADALQDLESGEEKELFPRALATDPDFAVWRKRAEYNAELRLTGKPLVAEAEPPAWDTTPTFGDGTPLPEDYRLFSTGLY